MEQSDPASSEARFERCRRATAAHFDDADIVVTKSLLATLNGPVVLVGHSYGGIVVSGAANGVPDVKALVYIAAFGWTKARALKALGKQGPARQARRSSSARRHGFLWINRDGFAKAFRRRC